MKLRPFALLSAGLLAALTTVSASASTVVTLSTCNFAFGPFAGIASVGGFDQAECTFASTTSTSVATSGFAGMYIDPSFHGPYDVLIDLHTSSGWVNVFDSPDYGADTAVVSILPGTISFGAMTVDGLRLRSTTFESWSFHSGSGSETFTLDSAVPEPASIALVGLSLLGLGLTRRNLRQGN